MLVALVLPSAAWISLDRTVWPFDQAHYGEVTVDLYRALSNPDGQWLEGMRKAVGFKPPGIAWLGQWVVPAGQWGGSIETALLGSVLLCQLGTLILVFSMGRRLLPDRPLIAMTGAVLIAAAPLFVGMSHNYFAEPLQTFAVAWVFHIATRGPGSSRVRLLAELIAAAALGMLAKTTTPLYCLLAGLLGIIWMIRSRRPDARRAWGAVIVDWGALASSLVFAACAAVWFRQNAKRVIEHVQIASSGDASLLYGSIRPFLAKLQFWASAMQRSYWLEPLMWMLLTSAAVALVLRGVGMSVGRRRPFGRIDFVAVAALIHVVAVICILSMSINEENRYLVPLVVPVAVLIMWTLSQFPSWSLASVVLAMAAGQWGLVHLQAFGWIDRQPTMTHWLIPLERDARGSDELARVVQATATDETRGRINMIGVEYPWFNANSASFYAAKAALSGVPRCYYTSLGYAEDEVEAAWHRLLTDINAPFFVTIARDHRPPSDPLNRVSLPIMQRVELDERFVPQAFPSELGIVVYRRTDGPERPELGG